MHFDAALHQLGRNRIDWKAQNFVRLDRMSLVHGASESSRKVRLCFDKSFDTVQRQYCLGLPLITGLSLQPWLEESVADTFALNDQRGVLKSAQNWAAIAPTENDGPITKALASDPLINISLLENIMDPHGPIRPWISYFTAIKDSLGDNEEGQELLLSNI